MPKVAPTLLCPAGPSNPPGWPKSFQAAPSHLNTRTEPRVCSVPPYCAPTATIVPSALSATEEPNLSPTFRPSRSPPRWFQAVPLYRYTRTRPEFSLRTCMAKS